MDAWSVGCILAKLLGCKPLFPGEDTLHQLEFILEVLGMPDDDDLLFIPEPRERNYILTFPQSCGVDFFKLYPGVDPWAINLLQRMHTFDPSKRITAKEALNHRYLHDWYDPVHHPPVVPKPIDIVIGESHVEDLLRKTMWHEMLRYHPETTICCE
ncbi:hypothetical protein Droror1_Dr00024310 [Drosera rotundifolia]